MTPVTSATSPPTPALTVGLGLFTGQHPEGGSPLYGQALEIAVAAEANGFDTFWTSEHHGLADGYLPSPLPLLGAVAARTSTIGLGTGVATAPLHHPVRLAEDAAVVDHLSDGRLVLGLGLGYARHEYETFGVDEAGRGARLTHLLTFLRAAWAGDELTVEGPAFRGRVRVSPPAVRPGGIPLWVGGYAPAAVRRAGQHADGYLVGRGDADIVAATSGLLEQVRPPSDPSFTMAVNLLVALADDAQDADDVRRGFAHQQRTYEQIQQGRDVFAGHVAAPTAPPSSAEVDRYFHAIGNPDELVEAIVTALEPLQQWANLHVVVRALVPQVDLGRQLRRVERLGREVLPAVRRALR